MLPLFIEICPNQYPRLTGKLSRACAVPKFWKGSAVNLVFAVSALMLSALAHCQPPMPLVITAL